MSSAQVAKLVDARDLCKIEHPDSETAGVNGVKFGETLTRNGDGNPERSPPLYTLSPLGRG